MGQMPPMGQMQFGQMAPVGQMPPQPRKSWTGLIVGSVIVIMVLLVIIAVGAALALTRVGAGSGSPASPAPTPTAAASSSIPAGFQQYKDADGTYSLNVPSNWSRTASNDVGKGVLFKSADSTGIFEIVSVPGSLGNNAKELEDGFFQGLSKGVADGKIKNSQGPTTISQGGESWTREAGDITNGSDSAHAVVAVTTHSGATYLVAYFATSDSFSSLDAQDFTPMFTSFQFLQ